MSPADASYFFKTMSNADLPLIKRWLGAPRVVTDPDPANTRAVRAYEKAGFRAERMVETPDVTSLLMVRES